MWSKHFLILYFPYSTDIQALNDSDLMRGTKDEIDGRSPVWERCLSGQPHVWLVVTSTRAHVLTEIRTDSMEEGRLCPIIHYSMGPTYVAEQDLHNTHSVVG